MGFRRSGAPLRRNPSPAGEKPVFFVYHRYRRRKGVDKWIFLLACVRVVHRSTQNQYLPQLFTRFLPARPKWEFRVASPETRYREDGTGEAGHTPEWNIVHLQPKTHLYTHGMAPPRFWWDCEAPEPLSGETLAPPEKSPVSYTHL